MSMREAGAQVDYKVGVSRELDQHTCLAARLDHRARLLAKSPSCPSSQITSHCGTAKSTESGMLI